MDPEDVKMVEYLKAMEVPPMKDFEEFKKYMADYGSGKAKTQMTSPRIPVFFGEQGKGEVSYRAWRHEVQSLASTVPKTYSNEVVLQAIRRSLRGHAADQLRYIGVNPTIEEIIYRFNSTYGMVETAESILKKFYACKQSSEESVADYCARLEEIHSEAIEMKALADTDGMLKRVFYRGLIPHLKHISQFKFEIVKDYTEFKKEVRQFENEFEEENKARNSSTEKVKTKCQSVNKKEDKAESSKIEEQLSTMTSMMEKLNARMEQLENQQQSAQCHQLHTQTQAQAQAHIPSHTGQQQSYTASPNTQYSDHSQTQGYRYPPPYYGQQQSFRPVGWRGVKHYRGPRSDRPRGQGPFRGQGRGQTSYRTQRPLAANTFLPECYACHERGHLARDCPLNH